MFKEVGSKMDLPKLEEEILKFWDDNQIFQKSLELTADNERYSFYDGPPFATGTPHYGHIVGSVMKDVVPRYWTMRGKYVERKWGWDCHGLPIENIAEKELGIRHKKDIEAMGVKKFNDVCRAKIDTYIKEWEVVIRRLGRWVDMKNAYRTMDLSYMETIWWVFKTLWDKGLVYEGYRSMHICPRCETTLSQSEVAEGYKMVKDLSVVAKFELLDEPNTFVLAWTTTPWTLIGNVALAVGRDIEYSKIRSINPATGEAEDYILASELVNDLFEDREYEFIEETKGVNLIGRKYKPLFDYYAKDQSLPNHANGWQIVDAEFVTTAEGAGIVHVAPAFGEDDMNLGKKLNLPFAQHVGMDGIIKPEAGEFAGMHVKDIEDTQKTDVEIIKYLAAKNLLFAKEKYEHSYPHCWRCDTPLLNYATSSWFVNVLKIKEEALNLAKEINWSPEHIKEGRFGNWLEGARDWSISRQRYWASVIPIWKCEKCAELSVVGSLDELRQNSTEPITKLIFVRHGESEKNVEKVYSCTLDKWPLTEKGRAHARSAAEQIGGEIDVIISSPVLRARETAAIIQQKHGAQVQYDELITETQHGEWNDQRKTDLKLTDDDFKCYKTLKGEEKFNYRLGRTGETRAEIVGRVEQFIKKILVEHRGKTIIISSHGNVYAALKKVLCGIGLDQYFREEEIDYGAPQIFYILASGKSIDLHKDVVDQIQLECSKCDGTMKRIPDVLDCWFESGSMPYAQIHYPFENQEKFDRSFPADFIAEGPDQTRAWFYYLHIIATALKNRISFKNVIVNGIVLAEDGKKMSKRLQNYPDPTAMFEKYGADVMRFYLMSSPVVAAENLNFKETDMAEISRGMFRMLWNSYSFFILYANIDHWPAQNLKLKNQNDKLVSQNLLDKWILSELNILIKSMNEQMEQYDLMRSARLLPEFIDNLSNWYIRRSRKRFWKSENDTDKEVAYQTLWTVLVTLAKLMAPFTPFIADEIYKNLTGEESVHLAEYPKADNNLINRELNSGMKRARSIVEMALSCRAMLGKEYKIRQPLGYLKYEDVSRLATELEDIIKDETNVKEMDYVKGNTRKVEVDPKITNDLRQEGMAREIVRQIQEMRKNAGFNVSDRITLSYETQSEILQQVMAGFGDAIAREVLAKKASSGRVNSEAETDLKLEGENIWLGIKRT